MNNKVKKRKHRHRYDRCVEVRQADKKFLQKYPCGKYCEPHEYCRCGKKRPLNNKVDG